MTTASATTANRIAVYGLILSAIGATAIVAVRVGAVEERLAFQGALIAEVRQDVKDMRKDLAPLRPIVGAAAAATAVAGRVQP
jgi:hypothetical protein